MLVIRRRAGESLLIGADIELEILEISPTRVKIGVKAPTSLPVLRKEAALTRAQNLIASQPASPQAIEWLSRKLASARR